MKIRWSTVLWASAATISTFAMLFDPRRNSHSNGPIPTERAELRRVFPELTGRESGQATLEFVDVEGPPIRLAPGSDGHHQVYVDGVAWGPASTQAIENAWSNLRMANVLRPVRAGVDTEVGRWGAIRVSVGDQTIALQLGKPAADGAGVYATRKDQDKIYVVEAELESLTRSAPELWVRRSMLAVEPASVQRVQWADGPEIYRGIDGRWRLRSTDPKGELLSSAAIELRLMRQLQAPLRRYVERSPELTQSLRSWLTVVEGEGPPLHVMLGGACPGDDELRVIDRGPGLLGCVDASVPESWQFRTEHGYGLMEVQLVPHRYGELIAVEQRKPLGVSMRRRPGRWEMATETAMDRFSVVAEAEVFRWFSRISELAFQSHVEGEEAPTASPFQPTWSLQLQFDGGETLDIECAQLRERAWCRRDGGPIQRVQGPELGLLRLSFEALADRQLLKFEVGSVRALEILDWRSGGAAMRQSVHSDYGQWRLGAPTHPDGDGGLDVVRLESLLTTLGDLRAERWLDEEDPGPVVRKIEPEYVPGLSPEHAGAIEVFARCAVRVAGSRLARVEQQVCDALHDDLLFRDPIAFFLRDAQTIDVEWAKQENGRTPERQFISPAGNGWKRVSDGAAVSSETAQALQRWMDLRTQALRSGEPDSPRRVMLHIRRKTGTALSLELGDAWMKIAGHDWYALMVADTP